ncbi:MAG: hypothetical protein AAGG68_12350 [Bacteroidota bacterium]
MRTLFFILFLLAIISCEKTGGRFLEEVLECVEAAILEDRKTKVLGSVQVQNVGGEDHCLLKLGVVPVENYILCAL